MAEKTITLAIEKLAGLGDGAGVHEGRRVFVPYTLPGEVVRAKIMRETKEADYAALEAVISPAAGRVAALCRHFSRCGGCALQHMEEEAYAHFKRQTALEAVRKAGFAPQAVGGLVRLPAASRRRVELKITQGGLGYYEERSHVLVDIEECKVLEPELEALILRLKSQLTHMPGVTGMQINGVDDGYDVVLTGVATEPWRLKEDPAIARVSARQDGKTRLLCQFRPVTVTLGAVKMEAPPGAFLQASRAAQAVMTDFVVGAVKGAGNVLDLFAGLGTYSFPLAAHAQVTAYESDAPMVNAMRKAARGQGIAALEAARRDLFSRPLAAAELRPYDAVVMNPPRAGAKEQSLALARAKVKKLVMISCNPATFARDARLLKEGGYRLVKAVPVDQFSYSAHLEILAEFAL